VYHPSFESNTRTPIVLALLVCTLIAGPITHGDEPAPPPAESKDTGPFRDWARETARETKGVFTDKKNLAILGATGAVSVIMMVSGADGSIRDGLHDTHFPYAIDEAGYYLGVAGPIAMTAGWYTYGKVTGNERSVEVARVLASALTIDAATTGAMKVVIGRHRPNDGGSETRFEPFSFSNRSFPSGHTSFSFTAAAVMSDMYDEKRWVKPVAYSAASLVGISRITQDEHWASDVLFGAVKGILIGKTVTRLHEKWNMENVDIVAGSSGDDTYLGLHVRF